MKAKKIISAFTVAVGSLLFIHDYFYHSFRNKNGDILEPHHGYWGLILMFLGFILGLESKKEIPVEEFTELGLKLLTKA